MQKRIMVLIESNNNIENCVPEEMATNKNEKLEAQPSVQKLFSCEEIERSIGSQLTETITKSTDEMKQVDPAIMSCSSKTQLTRYSKKELFALQKSKLSMEFPKCLMEPEILCLDIVNNVSEVTRMLSMLDTYSNNKVNQLNPTGGTWDPALVQFVANYNRYMLNNPIFANQMSNPYVNPLQGPNFMPPVDQTLLDNIPQYDRNNFFDTITTTTSMRAPPRMGVNSFNTGQNAYQNRGYNNNNGYVRRSSSFGSERYSNGNERYQNGFGKCSYGYNPKNDFNKSSSSHDGSMNEKAKELKDNTNKKAESLEKLINEVEASPSSAEPEWYTNPASIDDVIDLHGFEDGDIENQPQPQMPNAANEKGYGTPSLAYRRSGYNQNRNLRGNVNMNYNNNGAYHPNNIANNNNNQRFRNPLHFNNNPRQQSVPSSGWQNNINPFFDMWQKTRFVPGEACNFNNLMNRARNMPQNSQPINDVESALRAQNYLKSLINQSQMAPQQQTSMPISQFFNNWPQQQQQQAQMTAEAQMRVNGLMMPTTEQLQQHTTEILRNAMLRKNQQQYPYHDERTQFQK